MTRVVKTFSSIKLNLENQNVKKFKKYDTKSLVSYLFVFRGDNNGRAKLINYIYENLKPKDEEVADKGKFFHRDPLIPNSIDSKPKPKLKSADTTHQVMRHSKTKTQT